VSSRPARKLRERIETLALVLRRVPIGEADLMVTLFTRERGIVSVAARSARRPSSRLAALEPLHTLRVALEVGAGEEVAKLKEASLERPRLRLLEEERRLEGASVLLGYARAIVGEGPFEVASFDAVERGLDALVNAESEEIGALVAWSGGSLLAAAGYALELGACVRCGTACPDGAAALFDPEAGGLVCRACGGGAAAARRRAACPRRGLALHARWRARRWGRRARDARRRAHRPRARQRPSTWRARHVTQDRPRPVGGGVELEVGSPRVVPRE
jgi:DNA repair protein RecO (recombination protein O)